MTDTPPTGWLDAFCAELRGHRRGVPSASTVLTAPWCGPALGLSWYRRLLGGGIRPPQVAVLRGGEMLPALDFCRPGKSAVNYAVPVADPLALIRLLEDGCTVLMPRIEQWNAEVAAVSGALGRLLGCKVEAALSATAFGAERLAARHEDGDLLLVQLNGAKSWRIHPGPAAALETELTAGRLLYLPRGFAHAATGSEGLSVHLAFALREHDAHRPQPAARQLLLSAVPG